MTRQNKRVIVWVQLMPAISELALLLHFVLAVGWGYRWYQLHGQSGLQCRRPKSTSKINGIEP